MGAEESPLVSGSGKGLELEGNFYKTLRKMY